MIIYISDFNELGSGYQRIGANTCSSLVNDFNTEVIALGLNYRRGEHGYPFTVVSVPSFNHIPAIVNNILSSGITIDAMVVALDIPLQKMLIELSTNKIPYIGIFPLEAPPLSLEWAAALHMMDKRLVMSRLAEHELKRQGLDSVYMPIALDTAVKWKRVGADEKARIRKALGFKPDEFVVLTVADNQERKNLSAAMESFAKFSVKVQSYDEAGYALDIETVQPSRYVMVTRVSPDPPVGYDLTDLAMRYGILDKMEFIERGISTENLKLYYAAADVFLLTSKAEGLAIPQLEAMAMGVPVVVTDATAMQEHVHESHCGLGINVSYTLIDPFGNEERYLIDTSDAAMLLMDVKNKRVSDEELGKGQAYVFTRRWVDVAKIVKSAVDEVRNG